MLVITTTHLKESYLQRNGVPYSDEAKMTEYVMRDGDLLTIVVYVEDPIYLDAAVSKTDCDRKPDVGPE